MDVRVSGADDLVMSLRKISDEGLHEKVGQAIDDAADVVLEEAKRRVKFVTGALRDSLKKRVSRKNLYAKIEADYPKGTGRYVRTKKGEDRTREHYYAFAVEYGTRRNEAQPFLHPAVEAKEEGVLDIVNLAIEKAIDE